MFLGSYTPSFDQKSSRLALPKKIRSDLKSNEIILSFGFEQCLFGFDLKSWQKESGRQLQIPITNKKSRDVRRFLFSSAEHLRLDNQGRIVLSDTLLYFAKITKPIVIGAGDHFEIWDEYIWNRKRKTLEEVVL